MKDRLTAVGMWFVSKPWSIRVIALVVTLALALALGLSPKDLMLVAGPAGGGASGS
jgi:hypothetical protein